MKAPVGKRVVAFLMDCVIIGVLVGLLMGVGFAFMAVLRNAAGGIIAMLLILLGLVVFVAFVLLRDGLFGGRSPGKKLMKLRVVLSDGSQCRYVQSALRNVTLLVPVLGLIEMILPLVDKEGLRIGDKVAKTQVVV